MRGLARGRRGSPRALASIVGGTLLIASIAGCSGSGDGGSALKVAEARVSAKEKALADAKADLADKSAEFCGASETYITALDRYGDVLTQTAPTVGDVKTAGTDLSEPREDVMAERRGGRRGSAGRRRRRAGAGGRRGGAGRGQEHRLRGREHPGRHEQPEAAGAGRPRSTASSRPSHELSAAQQGITDETPLSQASQQFNAAAVALEMSWLRLFADAGCLTDEQQVQAEAAVRDYTTALQKSLRDAGYYDGEVDGVYGPATVDAVEALQKAHGLPSTGTVDKATADRARRPTWRPRAGPLAQEAVASTAAVQQTLKLAGFWDGPVDGEWTPELTEALKEFQTELGVKPTGTVDAATIAALEKAIAEANPEPSGSTSGSPSASSSPTGTNTSGSPSG